jgi:hypothetical protein
MSPSAPPSAGIVASMHRNCMKKRLRALAALCEYPGLALTLAGAAGQTLAK